MRRWKARAALLMAFVSLGIAAFFAWKVYEAQMEYQEGDDAYERIAGTVVPDSAEKPGETSAFPASETQDEFVPVVDMDALKSVNEDLVAWLYCPDTEIDYPVAYGADNEYYLTHLADRTYNRNGCLFIDCRNEPDFSDENTLIYGHHMASGKMFASLVGYEEQGYYDAHPYFYLMAGKKKYRIEVFSGYTAAVDSSAYTLAFGNRHDYAEWLREVSARSDFLPEAMTITTDDRIVTLSTCAYSFQNARYVVHGKLVELPETGN